MFTYTVYDNKTNRVVLSGVQYKYIEAYLDNENYTVVCNQNGMFI